MKRRILVADDDPVLADTICKVLGAQGYEVAVEYSGAAAVRRGASFQPDLALLGVVMPEMGGIEAGINLLRVSPSTKIVLLTESVPFETLEEIETCGYDFWTLPVTFSPQELRSVLLALE